MGRRGLGLLLGVAALAATTTPAAAQRFAVELRAGGSVGNYTQTEAGLDLLPLPSFAASFEVMMTRSVSAYVGINRSAFGCEEGLCTGKDVTLTSQGLTAGGRYALGPVWGRAGVALQTVRVESEVDVQTSDPGIGWDLAAGLSLPVGRSFVIRPGVTYLRHGAAIQGGDGHVALLAGELGIAMRF